MRLNKFISHNTFFSRREAEKLIKEGKVKIGNKIVKEPFYDVKDSEKIYIKNRLVKRKTKFEVIVYNKPKGELVSKTDPRGRKTVYDSLPKRFRYFMPVGRLDFQSEGLLILSDSSLVVEKLMSSNLTRIYNVKIKGDITPKIEKVMQEGLKIRDMSAGAHKLSNLKHIELRPFEWYEIKKNDKGFSKVKIALNEGKNREIRRFLLISKEKL